MIPVHSPPLPSSAGGSGATGRDRSAQIRSYTYKRLRQSRVIGASCPSPLHPNEGQLRVTASVEPRLVDRMPQPADPYADAFVPRSGSAGGSSTIAKGTLRTAHCPETPSWPGGGLAVISGGGLGVSRPPRGPDGAAALGHGVVRHPDT